ncbi:hypothetical protein [Streptomyces sp. PSAA01]|uniref:hypothetical protein n=1 Tax=Streptomyces sp. PSAA01 TaxID=2912762 RepID=UPI001F2AFD0D|nr:hypothetical protein [Streptomyces sp. PSAA01]MCG0287294.1 hypothetical protein [Streptomyces sp. PSAA01]
MQERIARLMEWLLRLVLPAPGRHRAVETRPGTETGLVRPYVVAQERQRRTARHGVKAVAL